MVGLGNVFDVGEPSASRQLLSRGTKTGLSHVEESLLWLAGPRAVRFDLTWGVWGWGVGGGGVFPGFSRGFPAPPPGAHPGGTGGTLTLKVGIKISFVSHRILEVIFPDFTCIFGSLFERFLYTFSISFPRPMF